MHCTILIKKYHFVFNISFNFLSNDLHIFYWWLFFRQVIPGFPSVCIFFSFLVNAHFFPYFFPNCSTLFSRVLHYVLRNHPKYKAIVSASVMLEQLFLWGCKHRLSAVDARQKCSAQFKHPLPFKVHFFTGFLQEKCTLLHWWSQ